MNLEHLIRCEKDAVSRIVFIWFLLSVYVDTLTKSDEVSVLVEQYMTSLYSKDKSPRASGGLPHIIHINGIKGAKKKFILYSR